MRRFRLIVAIAATAFLIVLLFLIDYGNFLSRSNLGYFLGILAMIIVIVNMILSNRVRK